MKKVRLLLILATLFFGVLAYYYMYHAGGGADGLSAFMPMVLFGVLFLCSLVGFLVSLLIRKEHSARTRNWILGAAITLPIMGVISAIGVFAYFNYEYQSNWEKSVAQEKSVLETQQFVDEDFGVSFQHISGRVTTFEGGTPIPTSITPVVENNMLTVPSDDESYLNPDVLMKIEADTPIVAESYFKDLKGELGLSNINLEKHDLGAFKNLGEEARLWTVEADFENRKKVANYFLLEGKDAPDIIYFLQTAEKPKVLWVLIISGTSYSAAADVEKMSTSDFQNGNLWFHTLELTE